MTSLQNFEKAILFGYDSLISDIINDFYIDDVCIASAKDYLINDDILETIRKRRSKLQQSENTYVDILIKGNRNEIEAHKEYMSKECDNLIALIDQHLSMIKLDENTDNINIYKRTLHGLSVVRTSLNEFKAKLQNL